MDHVENLKSLTPFTIMGRDGTKAVITKLTEDQIPTVYRTIRRVIDGGNSGVSSTEFTTEDTFRKCLSMSTVALSIMDSKGGNIIGFLNILPQEICRSALPICSRGYVIVDTAFTGKGLLFQILKHSTLCSISAGYLGQLGRRPAKYPSSSKIAGIVACTIPNGVHLSQSGWSDDTVFYGDFMKVFPYLRITKLSEEEVVSRALKSTWTRHFGLSPCEIHLEFTVTPPACQTAHVYHAYEGETREVYNMLVSAARIADGFGIDEFPSFYIFYKKYLAGRSLHVIKDESSGTLMGAVIVGQSHLTRGNPNFAMTYIYLLPSYRHRGYGTMIDSWIEEYLKTHGYAGVLTDMLMTKHNALRFATRAGYVNIGSVPRSAYVTKQGWTDAAVLHKKFDEPMGKSWKKDFSKRIPLKGSL